MSEMIPGVEKPLATLEQWLNEARPLLVYLPIAGGLAIVFAVETQFVGMPWWAGSIGLLGIPFATMWLALRRKVKRISAVVEFFKPRHPMKATRDR